MPVVRTDRRTHGHLTRKISRMHRSPNCHTIGTPLSARRASESSAMIHALAFVYQGELVYAHTRRIAFTPARKQYRIGLLFTGITKVTSAPGSHMPQTYDEMAAGPAWDTYCSNKRTEFTGNITVIQVFTAGYKVDSGRLMYKKF